MTLSLNEIDSLCRKAVRGAGLTWGQAEEAGKAARLLHSQNIDGAKAIADALNLIAAGTLEEFSPRFDAGIWRATCPVQSPLVSGPILQDWSFVLDQGQSVTYEKVSNPILFAAYAAMASKPNGLTISVAWANDQVVCCDGHIVGGSSIHSAGSAVDVTCQKCDDVDVATSAIASRADVSDEVLKRLEKYAHNTYAPDTEESRLAGAGAGLNDND